MLHPFLTPTQAIKLCPTSLQPNIPENPVKITVYVPNLGLCSTCFTKNIATASTFFHPTFSKFPQFWTTQMIPFFHTSSRIHCLKSTLPPSSYRNCSSYPLSRSPGSRNQFYLLNWRPKRGAGRPKNPRWWGCKGRTKLRQERVGTNSAARHSD